MKAYNEMELRSEKVRKILGTIPSSLVYWGISIIVIIIVVLMLVVTFMPYPYGKGESIFQHLFFTQQ